MERQQISYKSKEEDVDRRTVIDPRDYAKKARSNGCSNWPLIKLENSSGQDRNNVYQHDIK
jgi:hypothetical protein